LYAIEEKESPGFTSYSAISLVQAKSLSSSKIVLTEIKESADSKIGLLSSVSVSSPQKYDSIIEDSSISHL
jgi:hypothetical protein